MFKQDFAKRLQTEREAQKMTQKDLAKAIGISERSYRYFESPAKKTMPSALTLLRIVTVFDISLDYLFSRTDNSKSHKR